MRLDNSWVQRLHNDTATTTAVFESNLLLGLDDSRPQGEFPCSSPCNHIPGRRRLVAEKCGHSLEAVPYLHLLKLWHSTCCCRCCLEHVVDLASALVGREQSTSQRKRFQIRPLPRGSTSIEEMASVYDIRRGEGIELEAGLGNCPAQGRRHSPHRRTPHMTPWCTPMRTCVFLIEILKEDQFSNVAGSDRFNKPFIGCSVDDNQYLSGHQSTGVALTGICPLLLQTITAIPLPPGLIVYLLQPG